MEELRETFKLRQTFSFSSRKELFLSYFESQSLQPSSYLQSSFFSSYPEVLQILDHSQKNYDVITVSNFMDDYLESVKQLHFQMCEREVNVRTVNKSVKVLEEVIEEIEQGETGAGFGIENTVFVYFVQDKSFNNELSRIFHLRFLAGTIEKNFSLVKEEGGDEGTCGFNIDSDLECLFFQVQGRRIEDDRKKEGEYISLSNIELPLLELFTSIKPKHLKLDNIPSANLILTYKYMESEEPVIENFVEMKFELKLNKTQRLKIIKKLIGYYKHLQIDLEGGIEKREQLMTKLIEPFKTVVAYKKMMGLVPLKEKEDKRTCDPKCSLI